MIPRPRQQAFIDRSVAALRKHRTTLAVAPTAAGKTIMLSFIARAFRGSGVVLQHLIHLIDQNRDKFLQCYPEAEVGIVNADAKNPVCHADGWTFAMVQTLSRHPELLRPWELIIIDEAHHAVADTFGRIVDGVRALNPEVMVLGLTATPNRGDGVGLRAQFDNLADQITIAELIRSGHLVPARPYVRTLVKNSDVPRKGVDGEYDLNAAEKLMNTLSNLDRMVGEWETLAAGRKTIAFGCTVSHAAAMRDAWAARGHSADLVHGAMPEDERDEAMARFADGKTQVMTNCAVLTEGFDDQTISCVVLGRPSSYKSTVIQMIGRGFRTVNPDLHPGVIKTDCVVLDFGTSLEMIGSLEQVVNLDGDEDAGAAGDGDYKQCPQCGAEVPRNARECVFCGYEFVVNKEIEDKEVVADFAMREIDLLRTSPFKWQTIYGDRVTLAAGFNAWACILFYEGMWYTVGGARGARARLLAQSTIRYMAMAAGDDWMREHETEDTAKRSNSWLTKTMTDKQAEWLRLRPEDRLKNLHVSRYHATCLLSWDFHEDMIKRIVTNAAKATAATSGHDLHPVPA